MYDISLIGFFLFILYGFLLMISPKFKNYFDVFMKKHMSIPIFVLIFFFGSCFYIINNNSSDSIILKYFNNNINSSVNIEGIDRNIETSDLVVNNISPVWGYIKENSLRKYMKENKEIDDEIYIVLKGEIKNNGEDIFENSDINYTGEFENMRIGDLKCILNIEDLSDVKNKNLSSIGQMKLFDKNNKEFYFNTLNPIKENETYTFYCVFYLNKNKINKYFENKIEFNPKLYFELSGGTKSNQENFKLSIIDPNVNLNFLKPFILNKNKFTYYKFGTELYRYHSWYLISKKFNLNTMEYQLGRFMDVETFY